MFVPLQAPWVRKRIGLDSAELMVEMKLLAANGQIHSGVDAWAVLFRAIWWLWPIGYFLTAPGIHWLAGCLYRSIARNRSNLGGRCKTGRQEPARHRHSVFFELP
jgi:predicted DCC family thiol-disulfide oxidoreductase YuxK